MMLHNKLSEEEKTEDPIKHVIVLMLENRSFDQMLGSLKKIKPDIEGVDEKKLHFNRDNQGKKIYQKSITEKQILLDPLHEVPNVLKQISKNNRGFVQDFISNYPNSSQEDRQNIMGYYPFGFLPALHALAKEYTVCDHWFSSVPGPTWTNRFFALSGTSMGRVKMPERSRDPNLREFFLQRQDSIFDRLNEKNIAWRSYCGDVPISLVFKNNRRPDNLSHYRTMKDFYKDTEGSEDTFPAFSFIEPQYLGSDQNDDHPPHNIMKGEKLIADMYNAIRTNETLWKKSLFIITFDEHGGFYDHVTPPKAIAPDHHKRKGYDFTQLGVRIPAILISPWARKPVEKTIFDHTSLLKYLIDKWNLNSLRKRTKNANSIAIALDFKESPREDCLPSITVSDIDLVSPKPYLEQHDVNANHKAIHLLAELLNKEASIPIAPIPHVSRLVEYKDSLGDTLEQNGLLKLGMWCRHDADAHRKARIERTLKIIGTTLNQRALETKEAHTTPESPVEETVSTVHRCRIL